LSSNRRRNYELRATRIFAKDLERFDKPTNQRIVKSIDGLRSDPFLGKFLRGELKGLCSLRVGDYRVIYSIDMAKREIILHSARHRSKVYEE
jgi:mRNA interferase RelE/StbE